MILLELFWSFCKIGFTSFGGLSMVPLINSEMLSHRQSGGPVPHPADLRGCRRHV